MMKDYILGALAGVLILFGLAMNFDPKQTKKKKKRKVYLIKDIPDVEEQKKDEPADEPANEPVEEKPAEN